nr:MAG TPA: hypothetical protein [Caudoviricetes sp.]
MGQGSDCNPHTNRRRSAQVAGRFLVQYNENRTNVRLRLTYFCRFGIL